jgi:hypothetical protein
MPYFVCKNKEDALDSFCKILSTFYTTLAPGVV